MKKKAFTDSANKHRRFYFGEIINARPGEKSHRIPVDKEVQELADNLYRLIQLFGLQFEACNAIIYQEFGEGTGKQTFYYHFIDRNHGVGFNPRAKTLLKYRHLERVLTNMEKQFAKSQ